MKRFEDLEIWKESIVLAKEIYEVTKRGEFAKDFGLRDQLRRAAVSISSNIAEGYERNNNNVLIHYVRIAKGSAGEVRSQLFIAFELNYISKQEFNSLNVSLVELSSHLGGFIKYLNNKKANKEFLTR